MRHLATIDGRGRIGLACGAPLRVQAFPLMHVWAGRTYQRAKVECAACLVELDRRLEAGELAISARGLVVPVVKVRVAGELAGGAL